MGKENNNYINGYVRDQNNHPISFDTEGNLIDQITGEKGTMMLPGLTVRGVNPETKARNYSSAYHPESSLEFFDIMTRPLTRPFSISQQIGAIRNKMNGGTYWGSLLGNEENLGVVSKSFNKEHPYLSTITNIGADVVIPGISKLTKSIPIKYKTGSLRRYKKASNKYAVGDYIDGSTFSDDYPIYDALKGSNIYHEFTPPFFEQKIGNKNVVLLGLLDPGDFSRYWGERIIENMRLKGFNPDEISYNLVHNGIRTIGRPSQLIRSKAAEPIYIYTTPEKTNITGFYNSPSGRAFARISPKTTKEKLRSTTIHENVSHGTDAVVNTATRGAASREYQKITDNVSKKGLATIEGSEKWYELRSTMAQFMRKMYNNYRRANPGARYEDLKEIVNKEVDRMSLQETSEMLSKINGYGQNYAEYLKQNPFELNKFKELLKYGMGISAPIGITNYGFKNK